MDLGPIPIQKLEAWSAQISAVVGAFAAICGLFALFAAGIMCKFAGLLQIITGLLVVAIEGPLFLPQLAFAAPLTTLIASKPGWFKVVFYAVLTIIPTFPGCFKAFILGFIASALVTALHAVLIIGKRPSSDEFNIQPAQSSTMPQQDGGYSPTSP